MTSSPLSSAPPSPAFDMEAVHPLGRVYSTTLPAPSPVTRVLRSFTSINPLLPASTPLQKRLRTVPDLPAPSAIGSVPQSSPYQFDEDFYHGRFENSGMSPSIATYGAANNRHAKRMRIEHKRIINSAEIIQFAPLFKANPPRAFISLLPDSCRLDNLSSFFELFFREEEYELLAQHTNRYSKAWHALHSQEEELR